ncbi:DUF1822 family protein [Microcoleus sp. K1-B6]|uniref:DUF1822 family protein n=1 Tax=unclassified Microcoleus TaxID=2642155 RepID=UPI002FCFEC64
MLSQDLPNFCKEAAKTWKIKKLFNDLEETHRKLNKGQSLGDYEKHYLCLLLSGIEPMQMSDQLYDSVETTRVKITQSGLYKTIDKLTGGQVKNWRDPIILLVNKGYRQSEEVQEKEDILLMMTCDVEVSEQILRQLEDKVKHILGAKKLRIQKIEKGSIVIFWQGSGSAYEQIEVLFRQGILSDRLEVPVLDVRIVPSENPVNLSQWFENIFTTGWQSVEELLTPQQLRPAYFAESVQQAKRIDLQIDLISHTVILLLTLTRENAERVIVNLKVFPTAELPHLPAHLKLILLVEGEIFKEITSRSADQYIQYEFEEEPGNDFTVKLALGEAEITEEFVV